MRFRSYFFAALGGAALTIVACGSGDFDPISKVDSVRMFGVRADKPWAKPGDTVILQSLTTDARRDRPRPLQVYWIPLVCINPSEDLYYLCFTGSGDGGASLVAPFAGDGGAGSTGGLGSLAQIPRNTNLAAYLPTGDTFRFQLPADVVIPRAGTTAYGLAIVFNIACAGQVRLADLSGDNPQQVPIQCTDENGTPLGASDYVVGINRVYAYTDLTNANPVVDDVKLDGGVVDLDAGITLDHCTTRLVDDCPPVAIDVDVSASSWEVNPTETTTLHEQIWVDYYSDLGKFKDDARLLYDTKSGRVNESRVEFRAPKNAANGTVWAVVHDNRAGASFITFPLHIR
jgi:hypothetical protein